MPNETHVQFASRLLTNWDQYCNLRNVDDFNSLKELIVSDKSYETLDNETAVHINIKQEQTWFKPIQMGKECDMFYACKGRSFSEFIHRACHNQNDSRKYFKYIPPYLRRETCKELRKPEKIGDRAPITPIVHPELPFQIVNINVIGPIQPPSGRGNKYVLCMMDQHTRWPEVVPLRSLTAKTAWDSLLQIFSRAGILSIIASDQGANFKPALTQEFTKRIGSSPRFSCPG
ncbi:transposon Ty3-I Gag-Pol polyprotein [Trichonephila clavipes]|uniref:Transposon Ty3-I Gag-Pol polyprotein n=1 Tax=Trichonephila clavipes TaxID=2585209 RepID=A0A8X6S1L8_TRICX|nr:transposon Ty3-I Gag-Pol polyprotein [Trichonephila clavipes]